MKSRWWKRIGSISLAVTMASMTGLMPVTAEEVVSVEESEAISEAEEAEVASKTQAADAVSEEMILQVETKSDDYMGSALLVLQYYAKRACNIDINLTEDAFFYYDLNGDGTIDVTDAVCFLTMYAREAVGLDPVPSDGWALTTGPVVVEPEGSTEITEVVTSASTISETETSLIETTPVLETTTETTGTIAMTETVLETTTVVQAMTKPVVTTTTVASSGTTATQTTTKPVVTTTTRATTTTVAASGTTATQTTTKPITTIFGTATTRTTFESMITTSITTTTIPVTTYVTKTGIGTGAIFDGVDVSVYQGTIDWEKAKADGVEFAIIRAGYGKYASQEDRYFDQNMKNAKAAGLPCGAYWFSYALTPEDAVKEADAYYEVIKDYQFEYPVSFDMETAAQAQLSKETVSSIIEAFCGRMESYGYYTTLYSYASFLNYKVDERIFDEYDIWVAHYNTTKPAFQRSYGLWQYSSTSKVDGITGNVDKDFVYLDYEQIIKNAHLNGF